MNQSAQQITESKLQAKRERNRTISGETSSKVTSQHQESHSSSSSSYQAGSALSGITSALQQIEVDEQRVSSVRMPMPRKSRAQSLPRGHSSHEESSFRVSLPGSARTSRQASVERDRSRKGLSRHGSVEIFDGAYNLTVPNKLSRHTSTSKLEEIHSDHIKIVGELDHESASDNQVSNVKESQESTSNSSTGYQASSMSSNMSSSSMSSSSVQSSASSSMMSQQTRSKQTVSSQSQESCMIQSSSSQQRSHQTTSNETIVSGHKFNISNGLSRSRHVSGGA